MLLSSTIEARKVGGSFPTDERLPVGKVLRAWMRALKLTQSFEAASSGSLDWRKPVVDPMEGGGGDLDFVATLFKNELKHVCLPLSSAMRFQSSPTRPLR
jgi:hypothetical protein